jgi:uncharacterized protein (DUF305 family)
MTRIPRIPAALIALAAGLSLTLTGCSDGDDDASPRPTIPSSAEFNDADVAFATEMIPHHAQALLMVDMTRGRTLDPEFEALTEQILAAQAPEIELMTDWLEDWDQPVPETQRDHMHADGDSGMGMDSDDMPGMMSDDDLTELDGVHGSGFEDMWLRMMIEHHEGAIEMARDEQRDGEYPATLDLAESIESSQTKEIEQMESMLAD